MKTVLITLFATDRPEAIFEFVVIALGLLILGIILGWILFREKRSQKEKIKSLQGQINNMATKITDVEVNTSIYGNKLNDLEPRVSATQTKADQLFELKANKSTIDEVKANISILNESIDLLEKKATQFFEQKVYKEDTTAFDLSPESRSSLKDEIETSEEDAATLAKVQAKKHLLNFDSFGEASAMEKDDLKIISGIGPFIEKKLNMLGIYTFTQISRLSSEDIASLTEAIEFFPGRIERDHWVSQAKGLLK